MEHLEDFDAAEPTTADLAVVKGDIWKKDLKKSVLFKSLKKERRQSDDIGFMLKTLCDHKILTPEEEIDIATRLIDVRTRYHRALQQFRETTDSETPEALPMHIAKLGEKLIQERQEFARHNLRLVVSIAKRYRGTSMTLPDLVAEGSTGLMKAVDKYELRGNRFHTYATWWIRQAIQRGLCRARGIPISTDVFEKLYKIRTFEEHYALRHHGRKPSKEQLMEATGLSADEVWKLRKIAKNPKSLDAMIGKDDDRTEGQMLPDHRTSEADNTMHSEELSRILKMALEQDNRLQEKEIRCYVMMKGLLDGHPKRAAAVSRIVGMTPSVVKTYYKKVRRVLGLNENLKRLMNEYQQKKN